MVNLAAVKAKGNPWSAGWWGELERMREWSYNEQGKRMDHNLHQSWSLSRGWYNGRKGQTDQALWETSIGARENSGKTHKWNNFL